MQDYNFKISFLLPGKKSDVRLFAIMHGMRFYKSSLIAHQIYYDHNTSEKSHNLICQKDNLKIDVSELSGQNENPTLVAQQRFM